jgi:hypothetical protein
LSVFTFELIGNPFPPIQSPSFEDIVEVNPRQLAPIMGTLGVGVIDSMAFTPSSQSNSKADGNQISFGTVDFDHTHPP